jgi:hypothetical protein
MVLSREKKILSTEDKVRPNRDDSDHVLTILIDVNYNKKPGTYNATF